MRGNPPPRGPDDWFPYRDRIQFETANLFFRQIQLSASEIDSIMQLWFATATDGSPSPAPFQNHWDMYNTIDQTPLGDIPWSSFTLQYSREKPTDDVPQWMSKTFQVCYHNPCAVIHDILGHPGFKDDMDYAPYCKYDGKT
jgi:Plavaka transposase